MKNKKYKPGNGWRAIGSCVWENKDGTRVHMLGLIRLNNGVYFKANQWLDSIEAHRMIKINGGNRRRGLLAWAARLSI